MRKPIQERIQEQIARNPGPEMVRLERERIKNILGASVNNRCQAEFLALETNLTTSEAIRIMRGR